MAASHAAISISDFAASCTRIARYPWRCGIGINYTSTDHRMLTDANIGLCISGGSDSMALAALFSKLQKLNHESPTSLGHRRQPLGRIKAFIVDHQAREGSAEEANTVARRLKVLGPHCGLARRNPYTNVFRT